MIDTIRTNEKELTGKITQWFNDFFKNNDFPFQSATNETSIKVEKTTYFSDIVIWENEESRKAFTYIEIKPPFGKNEDLERFSKKANELRVKIAFTWNFQNLNAYKIEKNKTELIDSESNYILTNIEDWKRGDIQALLKAYIKKICEELLYLANNGHFTKFKPDKHYFIKFLREGVNSLIPIYSVFIKNESIKKENRDAINKYVVEQGIVYPSDNEYFKLISSQSVYGLVTKIIFYYTIRRYYSELPDLIDYTNDLNKTIKDAFYKAREKDWQAVFSDDIIESLGIPVEAYQYLIEIFANLKIYNFGELPEDIIGEIFEELIDPEHRHSLGQYFTREDLVDFVIATIVDNPEKLYIDPTCGSGTFLIRLYSRLKYLNPRLKHEEILNRIWGIDIGKFPAELSTINLFRQNISNFENFPRVLNKNLFDVKSGDLVEFPPLNAGKNYVKIKIPIPEFYGIVGNFPFIRQELIEKKSKNYKKHLTKITAEQYLFEYPDLFEFKNKHAILSIENHKNKDKNEKSYLIDSLLKNNSIDLKLSGQADIYAYMYLHVTKFLSNDGSILKDFILKHYKIKMIVASWVEPWFDDAAVNTIFTVLERCDKVTERNNNNVHFVKLKNKIEDIVGKYDMQFESIRRWQKFDGVIRTIETSSSFSRVINDKIKSFENENMLIRIIQQSELYNDIKTNKDNSKWGKFLRAPDIYFEIIDKCKDKLVPLNKIADIKRGITTGINEFFYLEPVEIAKESNYVSEPKEIYLTPNTKVICKNSRNWHGEIESCYLRKVIKSPKESDSIIIDSDKLKYFIFICNKSKDELKRLQHLGALNYIEWGEKQKTSENIEWTNVPSVSGRKYWWSIDYNIKQISIIPRFFDKKFIFPLINNDIYAGDTFFVFSPKNDDYYNKDFLNSTIFHLFIESNSRSNMGDGLLTFYGPEISNIPLISDDYLINYRDKIIPNFNIFESIKDKKRIKFDTAVLEALGLDASIYLPKIYSGLVQMVNERLEMPKLRRKQQKQKIKIAYDEIKKSVIVDCIGKSIKQFPLAFYDYSISNLDYEKLEFDVYNTSGKPLNFEYFLGHYTIKDSDNQEIIQTNNKEMVEFFIYIAKKNIYTIKMPKNKDIIKLILNNYKNYIYNLTEQIKTNSFQKLHSWADSERMTDEIINEFDLKQISI